MNIDRRRALVALTVAGLLWGSTVPLSKIALGWLPLGWLAAIRFGVAAAVLLAATPRSRLRGAWSPEVLAWGAAGYGGTVLLQNAGITRTSVSHAALLIGTAPVMVAIIAAVWHRSVARPVAWTGFAVSLGGVGLVAAGGGGGADLVGDGMVLASVLLSAVFTVGQTRLLRGRDPVAVTAVQFLGAALATAPFSVLTEGMPPALAHTTGLLAVAALIAAGTLLPFTLFAFGQSRLPAEIAGAFLNIEPLVGAVAGVVVFGNPVGLAQLGGGAAILGGIGISTMRLPRLRSCRSRPGPGRPGPGQRVVAERGLEQCGPQGRGARWCVLGWRGPRDHGQGQCGLRQARIGTPDSAGLPARRHHFRSRRPGGRPVPSCPSRSPRAFRTRAPGHPRRERHADRARAAATAGRPRGSIHQQCRLGRNRSARRRGKNAHAVTAEPAPSDY